jgi:hypothetical protein
MARDGYRLTNGQVSADVEFRTLENSGVEPRNPEFLRVHAAFVKVLNLCSAAEYFESVERDVGRSGALRLDGGTYFALLLMTRLAIMAH